MRFNRSFINVIGCGYAGIECALFLAGHGHKVHIFDACKEYKDYCNDCDFAKKREVNEALLSRELSLLGSPLIKAEEQLLLKGYNKKDLPEILLEIGKDMVKHNENIEYFEACVHEINPKEVTIIATGPNTDKKMFDFLLKQFGSMRCFSHMPVYPVLKKIDESRLLQKEFDEMLTMQLRCPLFLLQKLEEKLARSSLGRIVFIGSVYGGYGSAMEVGYSTIKGALSAFVKAYSKEVASLGITVNVVAPGAVDTRMNNMFSSDVKEQVAENIPMGKLAQPDQISYWVTCLLADRAEYLTGQTIYVTGGWLQ